MEDQGLPSRVLVVGSANMDLVVSCAEFPRPGETVLGSDFGMFPGGKGANQAVACARLGSDVWFIGKMGKDLFRKKLTASLERDGINLDHLLVDPSAPTGIALITVNRDGENEIVVAAGSNMRLTVAEIEARRESFSRADVLLLQLEIPLEVVIRAAQLGAEAGATVILNPAPARTLPDALLKNIDLLTPNKLEAELLSGIEVSDEASAEKAGRRLIDRGVGAVLITLGERGALLLTPEQSAYYPVRSVTPVDTTAAGDAFNGAMAHALAEGRDLDEAVAFANTVAAFAVTRRGAQAAMPTRAELTAFADGSDGQPASVNL